MAAEQPIYRVGERVDGLYDENTDDMWYPGRIRCVHQSEDTDSADGPTFEVLYDDGEVEMHVRLEFLRQHVAGTICVGTRVLCRYDGGEEFYSGQVSDVQENGMYTIAYDDGEVEEDVPLDHIIEPNEDEQGEPTEATQEEEDNDPRQVEEDEGAEETQQEEAELEDAQDFSRNPVNADSATDMQQENNGEDVNNGNNFDEPIATEKLENVKRPSAEEVNYIEAPQPAYQKEDHSDPTLEGVPAERTYIKESLQLLEKRLGDAASTKSVLSTLVKQMRAYPQITADLLHERGGERLIIDALKFHQSHAVIQCYGFVLLRRLCFLCVKSTHYLLRNGIVELVIQAMNAFSEDAILQASACGALAVFTRVHAGLNNLIEYQVAQLVLSTLIYHKTYSVHTRQVHYYACEVLLELCELDDLQTLNLLCGKQEEDFTSDMSPVSLLLFLLRQGLSLDDKKACCAVGSLLMCLAASGRRAAALILSLNGLAELSTVMARYPTEPSIQKYSAAASKQIAMCSVRQSPTKKIKDTASEILREAESLETTSADRQFTKRGVPRSRSTSVGKRKSNPNPGYGAPAYSRGAAYSSGTPHRNGQSFSKVSSPYGQGSSGLGGDTNSYGYSASSTAPQQPSSLVILDGSLGMDSGFGSANKRKLMSKEDRQSELFDAYGIQGMSNSSNGRSYGTKRAQLKAHLTSAESTWATPQQHEIFHTSSHSKPYSSRSDHAQEYSHRDFMSSRQNHWDYGIDEPQNPVYDSEVRPNRGAKRKKKTPGARTAFQVRIENEYQIRVSRETRSPYPSPQRLGVATKRAAKARQKRITGGANSSLAGRTNNPSSESLNDYATHLFQDTATHTGASVPTSSKLTPREKEEIRERERLSFAEKLHKMIDKAKSTLANGNTTSIATGNEAVRSQKVAVTKAARKAREPSADEKRLLSKKTRTAVGTSKNVTKEDVSPREAVETRPPKPTSGLSKRQEASNDAGVQQPVAPRSKPIASRSVVTPKGTTYFKPRTAVKSSRAPTQKFPDKQSVGKTGTPGEVASSKAPVVDEPPEVQPVAVVSELAPAPAQSTEQLGTPLEMLSSNQVEPSSEDAQVEASAVSEVVEVVVPESEPASSELEAGVPVKAEDEPQSVVPHDEDPCRKDTSEDEAIVASKPVEIDVVAHSEDAMTSIEQDCERENGMDTAKITAPELSEPPADGDQSSVCPLEEPSDVPKSGDEQPSAANTVADAMYGDDYSEFDDNGGDDEDIGADTDEPQTLAMGTSEPVIEVPLQESRSGEALYDDGSNEFDDDEAVEETENEEVPAVETVDNQASEASDISSTQVTEGVPDPLTPEMKSDHLEAEGEKPEVASAEETVPAPAEREDGLVHDINAENSDVSAEVVALESEYLVTEPEESQDQPSTAAGDDNVSHQDATQKELDSPEVNIEGENIVAEVNGPEQEDEAHDDPVDAVVGENTGGSSTLANEVDTAGKEKVYDTEIAPSVELTETEGAGKHSDPEIQPVNLDAEVHDTAAPSEAVVSNDCDVGEMRSGPGNAEDNPADDMQTDVPAEEPLAVSELSLLLISNSSDASIQSAAYDEGNFDDKETHQDVEATDAVEDSVVSQAQEAVDLVDQQLQEIVASVNAEVPKNTETENAVATSGDGVVEDESKVLLANSSEQSIQSAAYDDDDFDDGAQDDCAYEKSSDNAEGEERVPDEPQSSAIEVTDNTETNLLLDPIAPDDELVPAPGVVGEEDKAQDVLVEGEELSTVILQESPEQQQLDHSDSTSNTESGSAVAISPVIIENEAPVKTSAEVADDNAQAPLADETEQFDDDSRVDNADEAAPESENSSAATVAEDPVAPLPATADSPIEPSAENEVSAIEAPENSTVTDAAPALEPTEEVSDASSQPATYDDDEFENGEGGEQTKSSMTLDSGPPEDDRVDESVHDTSRDAQPSSEQASAESDDAAITEASSANDPTAVPQELPEAELQATDDSEKLADDSSPSLADEVEAESDATSDPTSRVNVEPQSTDNLVDNTVDQAGQPFMPDDTDASNDKAASPESETTSLEPELQPSTPGEEQEGLYPPDDFEPESAAPVDVSELAPQPEALPSDETGLIAVDTTQSTTTDSQCNDAFDGDQAPVPTPVNVTDAPVEILDTAPADLSVPTETPAELASEEAQYEDAEFDDVGKDAATEEDTVCGIEVAPSESGAVEVGSPTAVSNADELPSIEIAQAEVICAEVDNDDTEVTEVQVVPEEAADPAKQEKEDTSDLPEAVAGINEDAGTAVNEKASDDTGEGTVGHTSSDADIDHDSSSATEAELQDATSTPDAAAYDEGFPFESPDTHEGTASDDVVPETHEDVEVDATSSPVEKKVFNDDDAIIETERPGAATNEAEIPDVSADGMTQAFVGSDTAPTSAAKEEQYDDGFDDDIASAEPSDAGNTTDAPSEVDPVDDGDADAPGNTFGVSNDTDELQTEKLNEDHAGKEEDEPVTTESAAQEASAETTEEKDVGDLDQDAAGFVVEPEVVEFEDVASEATKAEETEVENVVFETTPPESAELVSLETEAVESEPSVPESAGSETVAQNVVEQKSAEPVVEESDSVENSATEPGFMETESVVVEPEVMPSELIESNTVESEYAETEELEMADAAVEPEVLQAAQLETEGPTKVGLETTDSEAVEAESTEPEAVVSEGEPTITVDSADVPEPPLESPSVEPVSVESVLPEASNDEPAVESLEEPTPADSLTTEDKSKSTTETITEVAMDTSLDTTEPNSNVDEERTANEVQEDARHAVVDVEDDVAVQDDYEDADPPADESDIATSDATEVDKKKVVEKESLSNQNVGEPTSDSSEVQEKLAVPDSSEALVIEVDAPESEEANEDVATPAAASEGPKTEDQYDDDNGYDDFDDQDHDEAAEPTIEVPAPVAAATEAPPTEDDYEDYENEDYGEDEKPVDTLVPEPVVQRSSSRREPPTSAREEEIEEVADGPEEAEEEAYADEDEYNNEYEEDDTPAPAPAPASKSPSPQKEPSPSRAEESADEYEDDNEEEEYAEDDVEESSPRPAAKEPPAPVVSTKSDVDELDDDVGYDSEYADSDG